MFSLVALLRLDSLDLIAWLCCFVLDMMYVPYRRIGTARTRFSMLLSVLLLTMFGFGQEICLWY